MVVHRCHVTWYYSNSSFRAVTWQSHVVICAPPHFSLHSSHSPLHPLYTPVSSNHCNTIRSVWSPLQETSHKERWHCACHERSSLPGLHGGPYSTVALAPSDCVSLHWSRGFWVTFTRQHRVDDSQCILWCHFQCKSTGVYRTVFSIVCKVGKVWSKVGVVSDQCGCG